MYWRWLDLFNSCNNSDGTVNGTVTLSSITTTKWKSLLGITNAPNNTYSINLEVTARNGFGSTFSSSKTFTVNFIEGINSINSPVLEIKTGNSTYTPIPDSYINAELANRYPIFET